MAKMLDRWFDKQYFRWHKGTIIVSGVLLLTSLSIWTFFHGFDRSCTDFDVADVMLVNEPIDTAKRNPEDYVGHLQSDVTGLTVRSGERCNTTEAIAIIACHQFENIMKPIEGTFAKYRDDYCSDDDFDNNCVQLTRVVLIQRALVILIAYGWAFAIIHLLVYWISASFTKGKIRSRRRGLGTLAGAISAGVSVSYGVSLWDFKNMSSYFVFSRIPRNYPYVLISHAPAYGYVSLGIVLSAIASTMFVLGTIRNFSAQRAFLEDLVKDQNLAMAVNKELQCE